MNVSTAFCRKLILGVLGLGAWTAVCSTAWAQAAEKASGGGGGGGGELYVASYALVILCIGLGMLAVCKSTRLRERPKGEQYESMGIADMVVSKREVPVISVGMRMDQVTKLLGKPKVARRGDDIYRELAQAGKLSEDDAAKEYLIYEHRAGRYELVVLDKYVVQVKTQPRGEQS